MRSEAQEPTGLVRLASRQRPTSGLELALRLTRGLDQGRALFAGELGRQVDPCGAGCYEHELRFVAQ